MTFSEKLIRLRKREGVSQEELASYLEVSRQAVSRWEQGTALPDAGNLLKLRQRFGVSVDWLLTEEQGWEALEGKTAAQTACESARTASQPGETEKYPAMGGSIGNILLGSAFVGDFRVFVPGTICQRRGGYTFRRICAGAGGNGLVWLFAVQPSGMAVLAVRDRGCRFSGSRNLAGGCVESDRNRAGTCGRRKERITGFRSACCGRIRG